jgi:hypothetical protein
MKDECHVHNLEKEYDTPEKVAELLKWMDTSWRFSHKCKLCLRSDSWCVLDNVFIKGTIPLIMSHCPLCLKKETRRIDYLDDPGYLWFPTYKYLQKMQSDAKREEQKAKGFFSRLLAWLEGKLK